MSARVLTTEEYADLMSKILVNQPVLPDHLNRLKQVHRLLASGHKAEDLTAVEQAYAKALNGLKLVQIPNDYGWEPGIEVMVEAEPEPRSEPRQELPKPKKGK